MPLEATDKPDQYKIWLTDREVGQLRRHAGSKRYDLLIQLGGYVGLRAFEIPQVCPRHVKRTDVGEHYRLRVPEEKILGRDSHRLAKLVYEELSPSDLE